MQIRKLKFNEILAIIATSLLIIGTVVFKPPLVEILPMYISIIVMLLNSNVSRYAFLLGGINSIFHTIASISLTLYSTAAQAFFVSMPFQIATFINWSKHTTNGETAIKRFSKKGRFLLFSIMILSWIILYIIFSFLNSSYLVLDNTVAVLSIASTILSLFRYCEGSVLSIISCVISLVLFAQVTIDNPEKCLWLVYNAYSAVCAFIAFIKMNRRSSN